MSKQITKTHLRFLQDAKKSFEEFPQRETYRDEKQGLIALRMGVDRDCIDVYELGVDIANFVQQLDPCPKPRKEIMAFAYWMEGQLKVNEHKGGWSKEHHEFLSRQLFRNLSMLDKDLSKEDQDKYEITLRCANIANFAMMIADNYGE